MEELNNPYFKYPGFPFSGYVNKTRYNSELNRLYDYINELHTQINQNTILHLSFGSAVEEYYNNVKTSGYFTEGYHNIDFQWQQLFPEHIQRAINENPEFRIINIIISPSKDFETDYIPVFIDKTPELNWYRYDENNTFMSRTNNIIVKIFNCPMPSNYDYTKIITKLESSGLYRDKTIIDNMIQTLYDKKFIAKFYSNLNDLFNKIYVYNGLVTCFSYAVFNDNTEKRIYNNYYLFREIKNLFGQNYTNSKRILAEWVYKLGFYNVLIYNSEEENIISYTKPQTLNVAESEFYELNFYTFRIKKTFYISTKENTLYKCLNINDTGKIKNFKKNILIKLNEFEKKESKFKNYDKSINIDRLEIVFNNTDELEKKTFLSTVLSVDINTIIFNKLELDIISSILSKRIVIIDTDGNHIHDTSKNQLFNLNYDDICTLEYDTKKMVFSNHTNNEFVHNEIV